MYDNRVEDNSARIAVMLTRAVGARLYAQQLEQDRQEKLRESHLAVFHNAPYCTCVGACVCRFASA